MTLLDAISANLLSPAVLFLVVGIGAAVPNSYKNSPAPFHDRLRFNLHPELV